MDKSGYGTLYGVGVGPGDPELLTLKAARILQKVPVIAVPFANIREESLALDIVMGLLASEQQILRLRFPMSTDSAERDACIRDAYSRINNRLETGQDVAFLTEGDPLLHSTFLYLLEKIPSQQKLEIIPGISSVMASAAGAHFPLARADQHLAVLPAAFLEMADLREALEKFDTVVLMKVYRVLDRVIDLLEETNLLDGAVLVERASQPGQMIHTDLKKLRGKSVPYFSTLILHGRGRHTGEGE